jgi:6-phosphogluconolactonase
MSEECIDLFVGTYTSGGGEGIYHTLFDPCSGRFRALELAANTENPSFLAISVDGRLLCSVNEVPGGSVTCFGIEAGTSRLAELGSAPSEGDDPCYVAFAPGERHVLVANYSSGSIAVLPLGLGGAPGVASQVIRFQGSGPDAVRQEGPHAHAILPDPHGSVVFATDLGTDMLHGYGWSKDRIEEMQGFPMKCRPGSGPRHLAFSGDRLLLLNELDSRIDVLSLHESHRRLSSVGDLPLVDAARVGKNAAADIHASADGRFVYASNRGEDSLVVFESIDAPPGLVFRQRIPSGGRTPRNFLLAPDGRHLLAANQQSGTVTVFERDTRTGLLSGGGEALKVPSPACLCTPARVPTAPGRRQTQ